MKRLLVVAALLCCALFAGAANGAMVRIGNLVLTADGGFTPRALPRHTYAPIHFKGRADLRALDGSVPAALQQLVLDFDRDGRLSTGGLASCDPALLQGAGTAEARGRCHAAIVGSGHIGILVASAEGVPVRASSPLTLFNGPRLEGNPTVLLHAQTTFPVTQSFLITVPIERRPGLFRYRATVTVPPIADGKGSIVHLDVSVGKRYRFRGAERSYVAARCSDGILRTHGRFTFSDGMLIDGSVDKACAFH